MFKATTVDAITAQMTKMVKELETLAEKREELSASALKQAEAIQAKAQADFDEAVKARNVAAKIAELVA